MNPKLRNMLVGVGVVVLSGTGFILFTPQPASRTMADLRDAGITDGQRIVLTCPGAYALRIPLTTAHPEQSPLPAPVEGLLFQRRAHA
jgi:hypothetical protein